MFNEYHITMDSFGDTCPANWEEIADHLNAIIDATPDITDPDTGDLTFEGREKIDALWEAYCAGDLPDAPAPVFDAERARHWYIIDDCMSSRSFCDSDKLDATTQKEAIDEALRRWNALTPHDQAQRDAYYVCSAQTDDDGCYDSDTEEDIYEIK